MTFDEHKLRELIVYLARKSEGDANFGTVKLNKLLFFADFSAYRRWGAAITGACYQKFDSGPAPREGAAIRIDLESDGSILEVERNYYGLRHRAIIARRDPNLEPFSGKEIALIDEIVERFRCSTAAEMVDRSHPFIGWAAARTNEDIPYETAYLNPEPPTRGDIERALQLRNNNWLDFETAK